MTFSIPAISATYEGRWQPETGRFSVPFSQGGGALPLELERGGLEARPVVAGLDGRWEGSITRNGTALRLILKIVTNTMRGTIAALDCARRDGHGPAGRRAVA